MAMNNFATYGSYRRAALSVGCSILSIRRWEQRIMPYRMAGGREREQLIGADQLLLSICLYIYPEASSDEIAVFIHSNGGDIYTRQ